MNLLNLCLRIPNLGILLYYLFFIVLNPYILIANSSMEILKYYMPLMVAFAHMLTLSGHKKLFGNLYEMEPKNFVSFVSSNFIFLSKKNFPSPTSSPDLLLPPFLRTFIYKLFCFIFLFNCNLFENL